MQEKKYRNEKVLVLGLGISGRAAVEFLLANEAHVVAVDRNASQLADSPSITVLKEKGLQLFSDTDPLKIQDYTLIVTSPGVSSTHPIILSALEHRVTVIGEIELACRHIHQPFLGITGTNGKTTVSLLIGHVLNHAGIPAKVLGNVGTPLSSEVSDAFNKTIVCELSSYQLETMHSKVMDAGVILNITPDHLDRHQNMEGYAKAKIQMVGCLKNDGELYVGEKVYKEFKHLFGCYVPKTIGFHSGCSVFCDKKSIFVKENIELILPDRYRGKTNHDIENIMAAFALCTEMGVKPSLFAEALETFRKPAHRIEFVKNLAGVSFYNDSKGTNLDAVIRAVESLEGNIVLIAGGIAKSGVFTPWINAFADKVKYICAIGDAKSKLIDELTGSFPVEACESLESAVKKAFAVAQEGESVLLSPGCASFDMFKNYEHRGDCFKEIVHALEG